MYLVTYKKNNCLKENQIIKYLHIQQHIGNISGINLIAYARLIANEFLQFDIFIFLFNLTFFFCISFSFNIIFFFLFFV